MTQSTDTSSPFIKYVGGKRRQVDRISSLLGKRFSAYGEPFIGGGAMYLFLRGSVGFKGPCVINDTNEMLVRMWRGVQADAEGVLREFHRHAELDSREYYYSVRQLQPTDPVEAAGLFIYLNKAGFNGLQRVNSKGLSNVPYGDGRPPKVNEDAVRAAHVALKDTVISQGDFAALDFYEGCAVYCDPPFLPLSRSANFTGYSKGGFGGADQFRLATWARRQRDRGARVVISNAGNDDSLVAFKGADEQHAIAAPRVVSCKGSDRKPVTEYLFVYSPK